MLTSILLTIF